MLFKFRKLNFQEIKELMGVIASLVLRTGS